MAKEYNIEKIEDLATLFNKFSNYFKTNPFKPFKLIAKKQGRTNKQLRYYWACITHMQEGFLDIGYHLTREEIHEFIKNESGFKKEFLIKDRVHYVTRSLSAKGDASVRELVDLIEFMKQWSAENLNYVIPDA